MFFSIENAKEHVLHAHRDWENESSSRGGGRVASLDSAPASSPPSLSSPQPGPHVEEEDSVDSLLMLSPSQEESSNYSKAKLVLKKVFDELPPSVQVAYNLESLADGFVLFISMAKRNNFESMEDLYMQYNNMYSKEDSTGQFISFFEKIQIKSFSEAIAESIGSIMKISTGKNRNLEPINFSKEIYLCFNLPPLHVLKKSFIPEVVGELRKNKRFFRETAKGAASYLAKLKYKDASSSLGNFRTKEELKCRLPLEFFK